MGQYEPEDSRNVTLKPGHEPGGIERTGPREDEARRQAEQGERADERGAQPGYGNAQDEQGRSEADQMEQGGISPDGDFGANAPDPSDRLRGDAMRPLNDD